MSTKKRLRSDSSYGLYSKRMKSDVHGPQDYASIEDVNCDYKVMMKSALELERSQPRMRLRSKYLDTHRVIVIRVIITLAVKFRLSVSTVWNSIRSTDKFVSETSLRSEDIALAAVTALFTSAKIIESRAERPRLLEISNYCRKFRGGRLGKMEVTPFDIIHTEFEMLKTGCLFTSKVSTPEFVNLFINNIVILHKKENKFTEEMPSHIAVYNQKFYEAADRRILASLKSPFLVSEYPSKIAAAVVYLAKKEVDAETEREIFPAEFIESVLGYSKEEYFPLIREIKFINCVKTSKF